MRSIFSSAAQPGVSEEKNVGRAGELKIHWAKPPAACTLWVLYGERDFQVQKKRLRVVSGNESVDSVHGLSTIANRARWEGWLMPG
jgi:hypothetical protein